MKPTPLDLRREDYPTLDGDRIDRLLRALNTSVGSIVQILNKGLRFADNVASVSREVTLTSADLPVSFANELKAAPTDVFVTRAVSTASGVDTPALVYGVSWSADREHIKIHAIGNLSAGVKYRIRLRIVAG